MICHRICRRAHRALDGEGARRFGGRWNSPGTAVVYASSTLALAALEFLVHLDAADAPHDLVAVRIEIPDDAAMATLDVATLPARWHRYPAPEACLRAGQRWIDAARHVAILVPSAPVPEEMNVLINPGHPEFRRVRVLGSRAFRFDDRLVERTGAKRAPRH